MGRVSAGAQKARPHTAPPQPLAEGSCGRREHHPQNTQSQLDLGTFVLGLKDTLRARHCLHCRRTPGTQLHLSPPKLL